MYYHEDEFIEGPLGLHGYHVEYVPGSREVSEPEESAQDAAELLQIREMTQQMLGYLTLAEAEAIKYRFGIGLGKTYTDKETAEILGVSQPAINQRINNALSKLPEIAQTVFGKDFVDEYLSQIETGNIQRIA